MAEFTKQDIGKVLAKQGILIAFALFIIGFTIANPKFLTLDNFENVVRSSAILGVMALGVTFVVISGNLDLSVGSMMSFSTIVVLDLHDKLGPTLAIPAMFAMTLCIGAFIGFLVGYLKLNSLIVTLGMLSAIHGLTLTYSGGKNMDIADKEGTWFAIFGQGNILGIQNSDPDIHLAGRFAGDRPGQDTVWPQGLRGRRQWHGGNLLGHPAGTRGLCLLPDERVLRCDCRSHSGQPFNGVAKHCGAGVGA